MAHFPRWGGPDVDSPAMLSAYLDWASSASESEFSATFPHLWMVGHRFSNLGGTPLRLGALLFQRGHAWTRTACGAQRRGVDTSSGGLTPSGWGETRPCADRER